MDTKEIEVLLAGAYPDCEFSVEGGDGRYMVIGTGPAFEGKNPVQRQQAVYKVLNPHISSGAIHAVSMRLQTPAERDSA